MIKKVLATLLILCLAGIGVLALLLFTPLPYIPVNLLLKSSSDISGHMTGSLNSGARIENLVIKVKPEGEISIKEFVMKNNTILDYYLHDRVVIKQLVMNGAKVNLPKGSFDNWQNIKNQLESRRFLFIPLKNENLSLIQVDDVKIDDVEMYLGKNETGSAMPMSAMSLFPGMMGNPSMKLPGKEGEKKEPKPFPTFILTSYEATNTRFSTYQSTRVAIAHRTKIENLEFDKTRFDLGLFEGEGNDLSFSVKRADPGTQATHQIAGVFKKTAGPNLKKDITISGSFAWMTYLDLGFFDNKIKLNIAGKAPGAMLPEASFTIADLSLQDYFRDTAPIANMEFTFRLADMMGARQRPALYFNLGQTKFMLANFNKSMGWKPGDPPAAAPIEIASAQSVTPAGYTAKIFFDTKLDGRLLIKLDSIPAGGDPKIVLSKVWFGKDYRQLSLQEWETLKSQASYFMMSPDDFVRPVQKPVKKTLPKTKKRRR